MKYLLTVLLLFSQWACAAPREIDRFHWSGVERIIAIGDIHGDYEHYLETLKAAGLVNSRGSWAGGATHLVQTGDIPDRGPDTRKIIDHLAKLSKEASRKGGRVHALMGNHEAMNVYGDLRYVSTGEYEAFATRNSAKLRDRYFTLVMQDFQQRDPEGFAALPGNFREQWDKEHPLGWVEHRQAWDPAWNPEGEYFEWAIARPVAIQVNDFIFLHGGISGLYCQNSLQSLTEMADKGLRAFDPANPGILQDEYGPLWYRGLSGVEPTAPAESVQAILEHHKAGHIVVGHTPTGGIIWPRYNGRVIQIDTGMSAAYGGHVAYLEITADGLFAGYPKGRVKLPADEAGVLPYLEQVIALDPENAHLKKLRAEVVAQPVRETGSASESPDVESGPMATDPKSEAAAEVVDVEAEADSASGAKVLVVESEEVFAIPICGASG